MKKDKLCGLPKRIKVKVIKGKSGVYIAELPDYDIFTEADDLLDLILNINDLIYAFFEVSKKYQGKIYYLPPIIRRDKSKGLGKTNMPIFFKALFSPELSKSRFLQ